MLERFKAFGFRFWVLGRLGLERFKAFGFDKHIRGHLPVTHAPSAAAVQAPSTTCDHMISND